MRTLILFLAVVLATATLPASAGGHTKAGKPRLKVGQGVSVKPFTWSVPTKEKAHDKWATAELSVPTTVLTKAKKASIGELQEKIKVIARRAFAEVMAGYSAAELQPDDPAELERLAKEVGEKMTPKVIAGLKKVDLAFKDKDDKVEVSHLRLTKEFRGWRRY